MRAWLVVLVIACGSRSHGPRLQPALEPGARCFAISQRYAATLRNSALTAAVATVRERLDGVADASVVERDNHLVVEFSDPDAQKIRARIERAGRLELKVVDDGSSYMKRLFTYVQGHSGTVTADVDVWTGEDGTRHTDFYLAAPDRAALERYVADLAKSDPSYRLPDDRELGFEQRDAKSWRTYYLERAAALTGTAIGEAEAATDPNTNKPIVLVTFNKFGTRMLGELTTRIVGHKLAFVFDGRVRSAPVILGPITGGRASIMMGGGDAVAQESDRDDLVAVLETGPLPAPLHEIASTTVP